MILTHIIYSECIFRKPHHLKCTAAVSQNGAGGCDDGIDIIAHKQLEAVALIFGNRDARK